VLKNKNLKTNITSCLVVFGDGSDDFKNAATRLGEQAKNLKVFNEIKVLDSEKLSSLSPRYENDFNQIKTLTRYPLYFRAIKPWAILSALEAETRHFDVVAYLDAGCEIPNNWVTRKKLQNLLSFTFKNGAIAEQTGYPEKSYSRKNLIEKFKFNPEYIYSGQIQSTWSMFRNTQENIKFMLEWIELSDPTFNFWQDPGASEMKFEDPEFIENRWDQSIFSLLYKSYNLPIKTTYWEYGGKFGSVRGISIPIHATRNKTGKSKLPKFHTSTFLAILAMAINFFMDKTRRVRKKQVINSF
jgi:hypothetical protein